MVTNNCFEKKFYNVLKKYESFDNQILVVAVSGGVDSIVLFEQLLSMREKFNYTLVCAHVNHNIRKESEEEATFVEKLCIVNNVLYEYMKIESYEEGNFQSIAREKRYIFFENLLKKYNSKYLITAHHGDDLAETILMRISRGSSLKGYYGFTEMDNRNEYNLFRPFLSFGKDEIIKYAKDKNVEYREDMSNFSENYTRNRIRHNIIPMWKKETSDLPKKVLKFSNRLKDIENYISKIVEEKGKKYIKKGIISTDDLQYEDQVIVDEIFKKFLENIYKNKIIDINDEHILLMSKLMKSDKGTATISLPHNIVIEKRYNKIFKKDDFNKCETYRMELTKDLVLPNGNEIIFSKESDDTSNYICRIFSEDIVLPLIVRSRKEKDKLYVKGMSGSKKVKDIFINEKISKDERENYPIVEDSSGKIVWIPGLKKSIFDKQKNEKCDIILRYLKREDD